MEEVYGKQQLEAMSPDQLYGEYRNFLAISSSK